MMRVVFYLVNSIFLDGESYFISSEIYLYLSVIVFSVFGALIGSALFDRLKDSKEAIKAILTGLLLTCGISLLASSFVDL